MHVYLPPPYLVLSGQWLLLRIMLLHGQLPPREHTCGLVYQYMEDNVLSETPASKSGLDCRSDCSIRLFPCPVLRQLQMVGFTLHTINLDLGGLLRVVTPTDDKVAGGSTRNRPVGYSH